MKTLNQRFLPQSLAEITKFAYNDQVEKTLLLNSKWKSIVPEQGDETDFNSKITATCIEELQLDNY